MRDEDGLGFVLNMAPDVAVYGPVALLGRVLPGLVEDTGEPLLAMRAMLSVGAVPDEVRAGGTRLKGAQRVHPACADAVPALSRRYGVKFTVDEDLGTGIADDFIAAARLLRDNPVGWTRYCACGEPHWGDRAAGLLLLNTERTHVVLQKRSMFVDRPNTWGLIGGAVDQGESPRKAALREAREEAGLPRKLTHFDRTITPPRPECGGWTYTYVVATMHWDGTDPVLPGSATDEADGAAWCPLAVLDHPSQHFPLHPGLARDWPLIRAEVLS